MFLTIILVCVLLPDEWYFNILLYHETIFVVNINTFYPSSISNSINCVIYIYIILYNIIYNKRTHTHADTYVYKIVVMFYSSVPFDSMTPLTESYMYRCTSDSVNKSGHAAML